jgi:hypothetical protein
MPKDLNPDTRATISSCFLLSKDAGTTEGERAAAKKQLDKLLAEFGLTMADAERIAAEQATISSDEDECTPRELVLVIIDLLRQYVWCPFEHVYLIAALWILHTRCYKQFRCTPRAIVYGPLSESGKSTLLTLMRFLSGGGDRLDDPTSASLFREIHKGIHETGLYSKFIDEMDLAQFDRVFYRTFNNGFLEGGHVKRTIGGQSVTFDVYAPLGFGSITKSQFTPQNLSRSLMFKMHKKGARKVEKKLKSEIYPTEDIIDVRYLIDLWAKRVGGNSPFDGKLNRWPEMPAALVDRDEDRWCPLLSIADDCGVGEEARAAATSPEFAIAQPHTKVDLVRDLIKVIDGLTVHPDRIWTEDAVKKLHEIHESPWGGEFTGLDGKKQPHKISQGELGNILRKEWEIAAQSVRIGDETKKGWYRWQFDQVRSDVGLPPATALVVSSRPARKRRRRVRRIDGGPLPPKSGTPAQMRAIATTVGITSRRSAPHTAQENRNEKSPSACQKC